MTPILNLTAEKKISTGKGAARKARNFSRIPAVLYGGKYKYNNISLSVSEKEFVREYVKGHIQSKLIELQFPDMNTTVIIKDIQLHPVTDKPIHIDFQEVDINTAVKVKVDVRIINDDKCPGIKKGGVLNIVQHSVQMLCHPHHIPEYLDVDVFGLEIGASLHISDVTLPPKTKPVDKSNFPIVSVSGVASSTQGNASSNATIEARR